MAMPSTTPVCCCLAGSKLVLGRLRARRTDRPAAIGRRRIGRRSRGCGRLLAGHRRVVCRTLVCSKLLACDRLAAVLPAGVVHLRPLGRVGAGLMVADVVAAFAQLETHLLAVLRVLQDTGRNR